ncbi:MAG: ribosome maturation factor RimM, partial [Gammaproteobacteria bacterium]|nr:ribosome maturation factor RimM [Gammaproteobacteria bacterium]NIR92542.1 ribosome maturation factor RimM [Gammaproteobacteria bacterium]NIW47223.1 ribosome maturation factor RimM [Gammaproteobacteria bacterium]NIX58743.1 ribosome maturation factor RimM [candidate division Zixibacteria bacterium]
RIAGIYGIKGWLKVISYTRPKDKILTYSPWIISHEDVLSEVRVTGSGKTDKTLRVALEGITDRDIA